MKDTPFLMFWRSVNHHRACHGKPEILFGEAKRRWATATEVFA